MRSLFAEAQDLLESAASVMDGGECADTAILVSRDGQIRILHAAGSVLHEPGGDRVYRIERRGGRVSVTARSASQRCVLETSTAVPAVRNPVTEMGFDLSARIRRISAGDTQRGIAATTARKRANRSLWSRLGPAICAERPHLLDSATQPVAEPRPKGAVGAHVAEPRRPQAEIFAGREDLADQ